MYPWWQVSSLTTPISIFAPTPESRVIGSRHCWTSRLVSVDLWTLLRASDSTHRKGTYSSGYWRGLERVGHCRYYVSYIQLEYANLALLNSIMYLKSFCECVDQAFSPSLNWLIFCMCRHVVNFDFPRHIEDYVHRIGRTGRAGWVILWHSAQLHSLLPWQPLLGPICRRTGKALSFITRENWQWARELTGILADAGQASGCGLLICITHAHTLQEVPDELVSMAERYEAYKKRKDQERNSVPGGFKRSHDRGRGRRGWNWMIAVNY